VAKTANNKKGDAGKSRPTQSKKAVAKRADTKPARSRTAQKPQAKGKAAKTGEKRGLGKFLRDVRVEMGKVTWPTRKDLAQSTLVVLVAVAIAAVYTLVLDTAFDKAVAFVVNLLT
jgi:preprotein translocase subunit SecE